MLEFGSAQWGVDRILGPPVTRRGGRQGKSVAEVAHYLQVQQTSKVDLTCLGDYIARFFHHDLTHSTRENTKFYVKNGNKLAISLKAWTQQIFIRAGQDAYFGPKLDELSPDLPLDLIRFDELSWQVFYHYPLALRKEGTSLANKIRTALKHYFELPKSQRLAKAWFVEALEDECRGVGLDTEEVASQMLFLYWGINTNISKMGYWMIAHALFRPHLVDLIRNETALAFENSDIPDGEYISNVQKCPKLNAFWLECLRLASSSTALRYVTEDTIIGDKILREGHTILMSARQLHLNTSSNAFGDDAAIFEDERFLKNTHLERNLNFRPFGGGKTLCPGRHLAKYMALTFVAQVFRKFDVTLAKDQPFPAYEEDKPTIGILSGKEDLLISLRARDGRQGM
ncbi:hypothetical protein SLS60_006292 [Paraconiothyrium brasiliense]|uniref:Cytochrome P450 n=1 Tax=Paraconiothyrium brasiliense TaxID=300254 RepID=A0ABR3RAB8_9PLEO